jgi:hypothetical protein
MRQGQGVGPAFFIFTKCYHICIQSIIGYRNRPAKRINPPVGGLKLFEFIRTAILEKILLAASLKVKFQKKLLTEIRNKLIEIRDPKKAVMT